MLARSPSCWTTSRPPRPSSSAKATTSSHGARARRCRSAATRPSSTTRTAARGRGPRCRTRTPATSSSPRRRASSSQTWRAGIMPAAAATAPCGRGTPRCRCSPSASTRSPSRSSTSRRPCCATSASSRRRMRGRSRVPPDRQRMVEEQLRLRDVADERVLAAMMSVPRELFVPEELRDRAYEDAALPIGDGQTISQPYMVAKICEALSLRGQERVLDVGGGSGYQAAVLAELAAEVDTIERIPALAARARANLVAAGYDRVRVHVGDGSRGLLERAPFDAIAVAAAAPSIPQTLYEQLQPRGRLVVPVGRFGVQRLELVVRSPEGPAVVKSLPCRFVPLLGEEGF